MERAFTHEKEPDNSVNHAHWYRNQSDSSFLFFLYTVTLAFLLKRFYQADQI